MNNVFRLYTPRIVGVYRPKTLYMEFVPYERISQETNLEPVTG